MPKQARNALIVGHCDLQLTTRQELERGAGHGFLSDEVVCRCRVKVGEERGATQLEVHLHAVTHVNAHRHMQRDLRRGGGGHLGLGIVIVILSQVKEEEALADAVMALPELLVAIEAQAEAAPFLHLSLG